jgi:hypothetical protein
MNDLEFDRPCKLFKKIIIIKVTKEVAKGVGGQQPFYSLLG